MTDTEFIETIKEYNSILPNGVKIKLSICKDDYDIFMSDTHGTLYSKYDFTSDDFERVLKHIQVEVDSL